MDMSKKQKIILLCIIGWLCLLLGMNHVNQLRVAEESGYADVEVKEWGISREYFNYDFKFPSDEQVIDIAEGLLNGKLTVLDTIDSRPYSFDNFDWNMTFSDSPSTFQLYLQSLTPILYLSKAYEITGKSEYLDMGEKFLEEWDKYRRLVPFCPGPRGFSGTTMELHCVQTI